MIGAVQELQKEREKLAGELAIGERSLDFLESHSEMMDQYFRNALQQSSAAQGLFKDRKSFCLLAVGGYGRQELCLHSDIDILVLFASRIPSQAKGLAEDLLYPLWDLGLDLGHGIRTISDCVGLCRDDFQVLTSLLDARFICGDSRLSFKVAEQLHSKVVRKKQRALAQWLQDQQEYRKERYGDASHLLEPDLKNGIGGLRDYHGMLWFSKAFFEVRSPRDLEIHGKLSHDEFEGLQSELRQILHIRNHLHHLAGRKNDRLGFAYQEKIARRLGFTDSAEMLAVEQFMGKLHAAMAGVKSLRRAFFMTHGDAVPSAGAPEERPREVDGYPIRSGQVHFPSATALAEGPELLMGIFQASGETGCPLSLESRRLVREFLYLADGTFRTSAPVVSAFLGILESPAAAMALEEMFELGLLEAFIPEFSAIRDRVLFDAYHVFPMGRHSVETFRNLTRIPQSQDILLLDIHSEIPKVQPLLLAALLHDIGKVGKSDHAERGAGIAHGILERLQYPDRQREDVIFLIRRHLLLAETASRRDLQDEKVVVQCAQIIGDVNRLYMLYLLTWADAAATGPRAWNDWISHLVQELFFKVLHILSKGELASPAAARTTETRRGRISAEMSKHLPADTVNAVMEALTPRYLLNMRPGVILRHVEMHQQLLRKRNHASEPICILEASDDFIQKSVELTFLARDRPGLFSDMAGVLALNSINVLSAEVYTWRDGTAVDVFTVTPPPDPMRASEIWEKVERDLHSVFTGKLSLPYRLDRKAASTFSTPVKPAHPPSVQIDNDASDFFTVIEVIADDRVGRLYAITRTLFDLRLDIRIAKIATKGDQIADVFYIRDLLGRKIEAQDHLSEIRNTLLHLLDSVSSSLTSYPAPDINTGNRAMPA